MIQGEKAVIISELRKEGYKLRCLLKVIELPKSAYYFELSKEDIVTKRNEEVLNQIIDIFEANRGRYGVRRVYHELINHGININHKRVQRLMHKAHLFGEWLKEKYHSYIDKVGKISDNIINRDFHTTAPLHKWTTDAS